MVDTSFVHKVSALAAIRLEPEEIEHLRKDLTRILAFVENLQKVDTENAKPLVNPQEGPMPLRDDTPVSQEPPAAILQNAPETADNFFLIPKFID